MPAPRTPASSPRSGTARPQPTARELLAAREALARRLLAEQAGTGTRTATRPTSRTAARPATPRTPRPASPRTGAPRVTTPRTGSPRTGSPRPAGGPVRRPAGARPAPRRAPARTPAARRERAATARRWSLRLGVTSLAAAVLPTVATVVLVGAGPVAPAQSPARAASVALAAQATLLEHAGRYRQLEQDVTQRRSELAAAEQALATARTSAAAAQAIVGTAAAGLYRQGAADRFPVLGLSVTDPARDPDVLHAAALAELADRDLQGAVVRARRSEDDVRQAQDRVTEARAAVATATTSATAALADTRAQVGTLSAAVAAQLAALGGAAGQTADQKALHRWQDYLAGLGAAGIEPPTAAALADPAHLPAGMSPALDAAGEVVPGVAWAAIGSKPVTVLPAETVAAVSAGLSQLGKPYVAGAAGPDSYDCGGFTAATWLLAGYALPGTPEQQWAAGTAVPAGQLEVGDLVVTDGGLDVGTYLGEGTVLGASAGGYRVAVRTLAPGADAVRVTLGAPSTANPALTPAPGMAACGAPLTPPGPTPAAWGGYANGRIPATALCPLGVGPHVLRCDAAAAYRAMSSAFESAFGTPLCITDSYRSYGSQLDAFFRKPSLAAEPGTSNHGWGLAVDLCAGVNVAGTPQYTWMAQNALRFGFLNPDWAQPWGEKPEPWHWEFGNLR